MRDDPADHDEGEAVDPGEHQHHLDVRQGAGPWRAGAAAEERAAEDRRRVDRPPLDRMDEQEPESDGGGADEAGDQALLVELRDVARSFVVNALGMGGWLGGRAGLSGHHPLLSGWRTDPFDG